MSGDYTRFTFEPRKRYSGVLMQQGRVQIDSDWNEEIDILRRRLRTTAFDMLGPIGVPYEVSPDAFKIGFIPGPPADLSIGPGRLYVDGIQIECFAEDGATYRNQPFHPPLMLPASGDAVAYLDVWEREVTYIEDGGLLDPALGGADTTTRRQTVWQLRVDPRRAAACGMPVGDPPSAGRLTSRAIAPPAPDDPCILPPASGYRGLENRLYRVEIQQGGALGTARFKWSRDNGSIVSAVREIAVSGTQTTLTVNRIGRDAFLRFRAGDWVSVTDDHRELAGESGDMALIVDIDETNRRIVLDRALPRPATRPFGATTAEIAGRHTRVQRWDQTASSNTIDADGLILTAAGPIAIEDGIEIDFSADPAGGSFRTGDYWVFWARTATATIEELVNAPPRGIRHHYVQVAAISGLGTAAPVISDCRPPPPQQGAGDCCCTIIVRPGEDIQAGIDALPPQGGCVCLKTGDHVARAPLRITRGSIVLKAESPGTTVRSAADGPVLIIGGGRERIEGVDVLGIDFEAGSAGADGAGVITVIRASRVRISHCGVTAKENRTFIGLVAQTSDHLSVLSSRFANLGGGMLVRERCEAFEADGNIVENSGRDIAVFGIAYMESAFACRITRNWVSGASFGIIVNDRPFDEADSLADLSLVTDNFVLCPSDPEGPANFRSAAIDVAADGCRIAGNRIQYADPTYIGIRIAGSFCEVSGNTVIARLKERNNQGPVAVQIGGVGTDAPKPVLAGIVANNTLAGLQHGIACIDASRLVINGNVIDALAAGRLGFGLTATRIDGAEISGNRIGGANAAIVLSNGRRNRLSGNDCRAGGFGITLIGETAPQVAGNRMDPLDFWGVYAYSIAERLDIIGNRLARCASQMSDLAFSIGCYSIVGEANISENEVFNSGSDGTAQARSKADYGIMGDLVLEARVEGNQVTYGNAGARSVTREDRALIMRGALELWVNSDIIALGFAAHILGNRFIGTGRTALVELREMRINDRTIVRFERAAFSNNHCWHFSSPNTEPRRAATVWLVGRAATVLGNQIKSTVRFFPSVNFNNMPGTFTGNVIAGDAINFTPPATPNIVLN